METVLAVLMALGIYVGIPIIIGLTICGTYILVEKRIRVTGKAQDKKETEVTAEKQEEKHSVAA